MRRLGSAGSAGIAFVIALPVYLATMNRSIGFMDRGELAAAAATWGIPHATGYPTLMLLAGTIVHLAPLRPVLVLNLLAAFLVALGVALLAMVFDYVLASVAPGLAIRPRRVLSILGSVFVGFTTTWWQQANGFEVYALHCVFMPLLVLLCLRWIDAERMESQAERSHAARRALLFGFMTGLALTNHLTTVLLAPGLMTVAFVRLGAKRFATALRFLVPGFLLGLLPYAWLPIRAAAHPVFDWGDPQTLRAFLHHVTGADYRGWMFSGMATAAPQLRFLGWRVSADFVWIGIVPVALGAVLLARRAVWLAALASLVVITGAAFAVNYRIPDIDSYLLTTVFGLGIMFVAGLARISERFGLRTAFVCGLALVLTSGALHWHECDESGPSLAEEFFRDLVGPLPRGAVVFTTIWGQAVSPAWYFQTVEGVRRDVTIIDPDLVRVSWYLDGLKRREPTLVHRVAPDFDRYRAMLRGAEQGKPYDGSVIEEARQRFLTGLAEAAMYDRAVFSTGNIPRLNAGGSRAPYHLALWLRPDTAYVAEPPWRYAFRPWKGRIDMDVAQTCQAYAESRLTRALYESHHERTALVAALVASAAAFDPHIRPQAIGPMPLDNERVILDVAGFFRNLSDARTPRMTGR